MADQRVSVEAASINNIAAATNGRVAVTMQPKDGAENHREADAFISSVGPQSRIDRAPIPLYQNMLKRGQMMSEPVTGIGINVDPNGRLIEPDGDISQRVFSVGPNTGGRALVEEGRIGPTYQVVSGLRNRAERVAEALLAKRVKELDNPIEVSEVSRTLAQILNMQGPHKGFTPQLSAPLLRPGGRGAA